MSLHIAYGWVEVPALVPQGRMTGLLNLGTFAEGVTQKVRGWFCWGCRGVAPEAVGILPFAQAHKDCAELAKEGKS